MIHATQKSGQREVSLNVIELGNRQDDCWKHFKSCYCWWCTKYHSALARKATTNISEESEKTTVKSRGSIEGFTADFVHFLRTDLCIHEHGAEKRLRWGALKDAHRLAVKCCEHLHLCPCNATSLGVVLSWKSIVLVALQCNCHFDFTVFGHVGMEQIPECSMTIWKDDGIT